jgi:hypothetical protein
LRDKSKPKDSKIAKAALQPALAIFVNLAPFAVELFPSYPANFAAAVIETLPFGSMAHSVASLPSADGAPAMVKLPVS